MPLRSAEGKDLGYSSILLLKAELPLVQQRIRAIELSTSYRDATWELDFLYERRPAQQAPSAEEADHELFDAVREMKGTTELAQQHHYDETIEAMNRMRKENSRPPL